MITILPFATEFRLTQRLLSVLSYKKIVFYLLLFFFFFYSILDPNNVLYIIILLCYCAERTDKMFLLPRETRVHNNNTRSFQWIFTTSSRVTAVTTASSLCAKTTTPQDAAICRAYKTI